MSGAGGINGIKVLPPHMINKIAAGEVVERPVSVVKELVENSIDAGASAVTVEIRDGGLSLIRVTDNGRGIPPEQAATAFLQHATSKVEDYDDLINVLTLGFRGEALPSIAAVAQVEMVTKAAGELAGRRVAINGGETVADEDIGCAEGTTIIVRNLFHNTPARLKFLKKPASEAAAVSDMMNKLAVGHPEITLKYLNNGETALQTNGSGDLKTAIYYVLGRETAAKLIAVDFHEDGWDISGYVGKPEISRSNRNYQLFYINGRYVKNELLRDALEEAFRSMLMTGRFPVAVIKLDIPPREVDVNAHPAKLEVRFPDEERVFRRVRTAVQAALAEYDLIPLADERAKPPKTFSERLRKFSETANTPVYEVAEEPKIDCAAKPGPKPTPAQTPSFKPLPRDVVRGILENPASKPDVKEPPAAPVFIEEDEPRKRGEKFFTDYKIIGQVFANYWIVEQGDSLFFVDQHAAHERILYEKYMKAMEAGAVPSQRLLTPIAAELSPTERQTFYDNREVFENFGFDFDTTAKSVVISAAPLLLNAPADADFFMEMLDKAGKISNAGDVYALKRHATATAACRAAVKANDRLSAAEAEAIIQGLLLLDDPFTCPHGRPTIIETPRKEWEKKFKRIV